MSDLHTMVMNAMVCDEHDEIVGMVTGYVIHGHKMRIRIATLPDEEDFEDDPDDGDKEEIPEPEEKPVDAKSGKNIVEIKKAINE